MPHVPGVGKRDDDTIRFSEGRAGEAGGVAREHESHANPRSA